MLKTIVTVSLLGLLSTSSFARGGRKGFKVLDELNLTSEQIEKVEQFKSEHSKKREARKEERKNNREKMKQLFLEGASDSEMRKLHESITQQHGTRGDKKLEKMIFLKNLLTKDQRKLYMEKKKEHRRDCKKGHQK